MQVRIAKRRAGGKDSLLLSPVGSVFAIGGKHFRKDPTHLESPQLILVNGLLRPTRRLQ